MLNNEADLGYAAGILDGEGYIGIYFNKDVRKSFGGYYGLIVRVAMCDIEAPQFLHQTFSGSSLFWRKAEPNKTNRGRHIWQVTGHRAKTFLETILPYLKIKKEQAALAIEFQKVKRQAGCPPRCFPGGVGSSQSALEIARDQAFSYRLKELKWKWKEAEGALRAM